jgi:hypothetical protein
MINPIIYTYPWHMPPQHFLLRLPFNMSCTFWLEHTQAMSALRIACGNRSRMKCLQCIDVFPDIHYFNILPNKLIVRRHRINGSFSSDSTPIAVHALRKSWKGLQGSAPSKVHPCPQCNKINSSGTTPYSLRASASLHMEEYTCNSKGGNHQKPQTHPTEQLV